MDRNPIFEHRGRFVFLRENAAACVFCDDSGKFSAPNSVGGRHGSGTNTFYASKAEFFLN
jgi:hypothetical protein